jgi:ATP-dependent Lon protease
MANKLKQRKSANRQNPKDFVSKRKRRSVKVSEEASKLAKERADKAANLKEFSKLLKERDNMNSTKFFKNNLSVIEQRSVINELQEINMAANVDKPYKILLLEANIPAEFKVVGLKKINMLESMDPSVGEFFKVKNWVDNFMLIPFNKYNNLPVKLSDGLDVCNAYMESSVKTLNEAVYGMHDAKMQIMQLVGQWIANPSATGTAVAIKGPAGVGKTTLVKDGISKIMNRPFALITLGGATDSCYLEGHSYTYEGSTWGKIVDILIQTKCSNPLIYFDELDKVSDTPKGEEIIGILTHLIDTTQNSNFHDKYFSEIDFNLSKALFIFSYNDESKINPILRDRMYRILTKGFGTPEKITISTDYLLPKIYKQINFVKEDVIIPTETLTHVIQTYTEKEEGVRNLKRCLETICTKLNLYRLMRPESDLFQTEKSFTVDFPFTVTVPVVDKLIKSEHIDKKWMNMYM